MNLTGSLVLASVLLIVLAAVLTAGLTAVLRVSDSRIRTLVEEGFAGAGALSQLRASVLATSPFAVLRILLLLSAAGAGLAAAVIGWGRAGLWAGGPISVGTVLVFGDMIPRALAARRPVRLALLAAPLLKQGSRTAGWVFFPLQWLERVLSRRKEDRDVTEEEREVRETLELGQEEGVLQVEEQGLVERAFQLDELTAWDAMTPRVDIFAWDDSRRLEDVIPELEAVPFSRVPVFQQSIDDITGILYVREAYQAFVAGRGDLPLSDLARDPIFVPGSLSLDKLLRDFQARRTHMGIVADEFGGTDGLITLEDVLEELVGEIVDETDTEEEPLKRTGAGEVEAQGGADVRDINEHFGVSLPSVEHRSLNGFILEELGSVPEAGTTLERAGLQIEVVEASETQVIKARLRRLQGAGQPENTPS
ncbi:MAG: HlyC/CorC family transporter [Gemmatimonadetes bacterium]|nr:HlyC/CorC family transporter [Gemmatimonadota bacterium]